MPLYNFFTARAEQFYYNEWLKSTLTGAPLLGSARSIYYKLNIREFAPIFPPHCLTAITRSLRNGISDFKRKKIVTPWYNRSWWDKGTISFIFVHLVGKIEDFNPVVDPIILSLQWYWSPGQIFIIGFFSALKLKKLSKFNLSKEKIQNIKKWAR